MSDSKKRRTEAQLTKDNYEDEDNEEGEEEDGTQEASAEEIKNRRILRRKKKQPNAPPAAATAMPMFNFSFGGDFGKPAEAPAAAVSASEKNEVSSQSTPALSKPLFDFSFNANAALDKPSATSAFAQFTSSPWNFNIGATTASQDASSDASANSSSAPAWADSSYTPSEDAPQRDSYVVSDEVKQLLAKEPPKSGEEDEKNIAQVTAKLYILSKKAEDNAAAAASNDEQAKVEKKQDADGKKEATSADAPAAMEWRELGVGVLKVNEIESNKARLVMRTKTTLKLILNSMIFAAMTLKKANEKQLLFTGTDLEGNVSTYSARFQKPEDCTAIEIAIATYKK